MKRLKKIVASALAVCLAIPLAGALAGCQPSEEYTPQLGAPQISPPAIEDAGTLRVGVNTNNSPLAGKSGERIIGVDVDIAAALADELGLAVQVKDVGSDGVKALEDGDVDVVLGIDSTSKEDGCWVSSQYLPTGVVLFETAASNLPTPTASSDVKVAAQVSSKSAWAVTNTFGENALVSASDLSKAFGDLGAGKVDYVASDAIIGLYAASRQDVEVKIAALLDTAAGYCAMCAPDNTELQEAVEAALETIVGNGVVDVIEDKWLGQTVSLATVSKIDAKPEATTNVAENDEADEDEEEGTSGSSSSSSSSSAARSA